MNPGELSQSELLEKFPLHSEFPAEAAYNAYCRFRGGRAVNGDFVPRFADAAEEVRAGWDFAARAVWEMACNAATMTQQTYPKQG